MAKTRSYKLLCPIARGLDRIGDRWTLLILRDLHAGPARFSDLQRGLVGIAANLLTDRLNKLVQDGLIIRMPGGHGASVYTLTELGQRTGNIIFELAAFGARFQPETDTIAPGNLRTVVTTLGAAARRIDTVGLSFCAALIVDGEEMELRIEDGTPRALYQPCAQPDVTLNTDYESLLAVSEGEMSMQDFATGHAALTVNTPGKDAEFMTVMTRIIEMLAEA